MILVRRDLYQLQYIQFMEEYVNEVDFGDTNRRILTPTQVQDFPFKSVGAIYGWQGQQAYIGTGFLIANNLVLTVAHNIYSKQRKSQLSHLVFYPGVSGTHKQKDGFQIIDRRLPQEYIDIEGQDPIKYDYALLKLEASIGKAELFELGTDYIEAKEEVSIIGYRAQSCDIDTAQQSCLWKSNAHSVDSDGITLRHHLSTLKGNSGSPILVKRENKHTVIAIHKGAPGENAAYNEARIITEDLMLNLIAWEKEMTDSKIKFRRILNSPQGTLEIDTAKWLEEKSIKLTVIASQQPKQIQNKPMKIRKVRLFEINNQIMAISEDEKKQITSLTLKLTGIDDAIQAYFIVHTVYG